MSERDEGFRAGVEAAAKVATDYAQRGQSKSDKIHAAYDIAAKINGLASPYAKVEDGKWVGIPGGALSPSPAPDAGMMAEREVLASHLREIAGRTSNIDEHTTLHLAADALTAFEKERKI